MIKNFFLYTLIYIPNCFIHWRWAKKQEKVIALRKEWEKHAKAGGCARCWTRKERHFIYERSPSLYLSLLCYGHLGDVCLIPEKMRHAYTDEIIAEKSPDFSPS